jgi:hypothetical protein
MTTLNIQTVTLNGQVTDNNVPVVHLWFGSEVWAPGTCHLEGRMA